MSVTAQSPNLLIHSGQGDYAVESLPDLSAVHAQISAVVDYRIVIDEKVATLYPQLLENLDTARIIRLAATEEEKTFTGVERVALFLQQTNASKCTTLVVIGGGILQDIGAFTAHIYYRGIPYVLIPTTLLSMADSCIGAKTGINLGAFKNQLGFFQSPARVLLWNGFTKTLARDDIRSGYGEILKLSIIGSAADYQGFADELDTHGFSNQQLAATIMRTLKIKQRVIEKDEYEIELRKILNYGHTFGHALESMTNHAVPHGLAVAWGVDVANFVAMRSGLLDTATFEGVHACIARHFSLKVNASYGAAGIASRMKRDKKATGATVTLVLPAALGDLRLVPTEVNGKLQALIAEYLASYDIFSQAT